MRIPSLALLLLLIAGPAISAPTIAKPTPASQLVIEAPVLATRVDGWIDIDTQGGVAGYQPTTKLTQPLAGKLETMVSKFRFAPVVENGKPINARARMRLSLVASKLPDGSMRVGVEHVSFPTGSDDKPEPLPSGITMKVVEKSRITYPQIVLRQGLNARVLVAVRLNLDGSVGDAVVRQSMLLNAKGGDRNVSTALAQFEAASLRSISSWRAAIDVPTGRTPRPDELTAMVAVDFTLDDSPGLQSGLWQWETRTAPRPLPWMDDPIAGSVPGVADVSGLDGFGPAGSRIKLLSSPAQQTL